MKKFISVAMVLAMVLALICTGCTKNGDGTTTSYNGIPSPSAISLNLTAGKDAECLAGFTPETLSCEVSQKGETKQFSFEGVSLDIILDKSGIVDFEQVILIVSDMDESVDITEDAKKDAGVFLAWSESGTAETPTRVFPKDIETGNQFVRNVTEILVIYYPVV